MKFIKLTLFIALFALLSGCSAIERTAYMQDVKNNQVLTIAKEQQIRIKPLDRLTVLVSSKDPELAAPFNSKSSYVSLSGNTMGTNASSASSLQILTVDENGMLDMPIIGKIFCTGKTRAEMAKEIADKIIEGNYISDASVNIQFADMKIFVLGEVTRPGQFDITRDQVTLLEALAMAGDMTIYGNRANVAVIRRNGDKEYEVFELNFLEGNQMTSPAFYLQQGDVIYVQPNKYKAATSEINQNRTFWLSIVSTLITATSLVLTIVNFAQRQ